MKPDRVAILITAVVTFAAVVYWSGMLEGRMEALETRMEVIINGLLHIEAEE